MAPSGPPGPPQGPPTPLPRGPFTAIVIMQLSNSLNMTVLFPFVAYMVDSFHVTDDVAKLGYYAGLLGSAALLGTFISSLGWGVLADRMGRKPVLLIGLFANCISALLFGLSTNLEMAVAVRFVGGLFASVGPVSRTSVAELCDRSNMAQGFSIIGSMFGLGLLLGPAIGGFLCEPAEKYPKLFAPDSIFAKFPYFLPCVALFFFALAGFLATLLYLPETLGQSKKGPPPAGQSQAEGVREPLLGATDKGQEGSKGQQGGPGKPLQSSLWEKAKTVLLRRNTVVATALFAVLTFISSAFSEGFPIWGLTPWELGGLHWGTNLVGLAQTSCGLALIPLQLFVYAPLVNRVGPVKALQLAAACGVIVLLFPVARVFGEGSMGVVVALCLLQALRSIPQCTYTSVYMLIAKSVQNPRDMGFVNGASQSISVLFMALAPESSASLLAFVTSVNNWLINPNLWFVSMALLYLSMVALTFLMEPVPSSGIPSGQ